MKLWEKGKKKDTKGVKFYGMTILKS